MPALANKMIGVLQVKGQFTRPWAAHSGDEDIPEFGEIVKSLGWRWAKALGTNYQYVTVGSDAADNGAIVYLRAQQTYRNSCSAPKLIQAALSRKDPVTGSVKTKEIPVGLTEIWVKPSVPTAAKTYTKNVQLFKPPPSPDPNAAPVMLDFHSIESCDHCRHIVPFMLCLQ
jgi:hypothetical protein